MGRTSSKRRAVLQIRRFPDLMVVVAGASAIFLGYCEVEWVDGWDGSALAVCALGGGSPECSLTNAGGRAGKLGMPLTRPF